MHMDLGNNVQFQLEFDDDSFTSQDLIDTAPTAGYDDIKKLLKESNQRIVCVKAGKWYEDHVKAVEVRILNWSGEKGISKYTDLLTVGTHSIHVMVMAGPAKSVFPYCPGCPKACTDI
jgi:hypothetical protein